jgi:hypothetical protein
MNWLGALGARKITGLQVMRDMRVLQSQHHTE